ncbi:MAG: DUF2934 domain-containing protein [Verrucomicrobiae bacterium]|nr:DUF2934 domain-containing protein [Verrucomicrobiae bacterium]
MIIIEPPSHEQIARRAYEIYEASGYKQGRCTDNWLQAERELTMDEGAALFSSGESQQIAQLAPRKLQSPAGASAREQAA